MKKLEALTIARNQYENHVAQVSGAWSVSDETAEEVAKALEVDLEDAMNEVERVNSEMYDDAWYDESRQVRQIIGDDAYEAFKDTEAFEMFEQEFDKNFYGISGTHNEVFWNYILENTEIEDEQ